MRHLKEHLSPPIVSMATMVRGGNFQEQLASYSQDRPLTRIGHDRIWKQPYTVVPFDSQESLEWIPIRSTGTQGAHTHDKAYHVKEFSRRERRRQQDRAGSDGGERKRRRGRRGEEGGRGERRRGEREESDSGGPATPFLLLPRLSCPGSVIRVGRGRSGRWMSQVGGCRRSPRTGGAGGNGREGLVGSEGSGFL